jgi:hypothetical protein
MINVEFVGLDALNAKISGVSGDVFARIEQAMGAIVEVVADRMRSRMQQLFHNPGVMQASVATSVAASGNTVTGTIGSYGLPYAHAQEYGGTWTIPEIFPVNGKALAFLFPGGFMPFKPGAATGGMMFTMHTKAHPVTLPERSYARSALAMERGNIVKQLAAAANEGAHANP